MITILPNPPIHPPAPVKSALPGNADPRSSSIARTEAVSAVATPGLPNGKTTLALKISQSQLSQRQGIDHVSSMVSNLLQRIKPERQHELDQSSVHATLTEMIGQLNGLTGNDDFSTTSSPADGEDASMAVNLNSALANMAGALANLSVGLTGAASSSAPQTIAASADHQAAEGAIDNLSSALESVSQAQAALNASADSYYQSSLNGNASALAAALSERLLANIDAASGDFDFNIEQTLLQSGEDALREKAAISALVTYLLQQ